MKIFLTTLFLIFIFFARDVSSQQYKVNFPHQNFLLKNQKENKAQSLIDSLKKSVLSLDENILKSVSTNSSEGLIDSTINIFSNQVKQKTYYTYNSNNQIIEYLTKYWKDNCWTTMNRTSLKFDSFGNNILYQSDHFTNGDWIPDNKSEFLYNKNNQFLFYKYYTWENEWKLTYSEIINYDSFGNVNFVELYIPDNEYTIFEFTFDSLSQMSEQIIFTQDFNKASQTTTKTVFQYDTEGYENIFNNYEWKNNNWVSVSRSLITYKENNAQKYIYENFVNNDWVYYEQEIYTYNDKDLIINYLDQIWDGINWVNSFMYEASFNENGKLLNRVDKNWENDAWTIRSEAHNLYDANNKLLNAVSDVYSESYHGKYEENFKYDSNQKMIYNNLTYFENDTFQSKRTFNFTYDQKGRQIMQVFSEWYLGGDESYYKTYTYYHNSTENVLRDDQFDITKYSLLQNYPNPFNPNTTISFVLPKSSNVKITLYNILGENVKTIADDWFPNGYNFIKFNGSGLSSGTYIYRLEADGIALSKKMIYLK